MRENAVILNKTNKQIDKTEIIGCRDIISYRDPVYAGLWVDGSIGLHTAVYLSSTSWAKIINHLCFTTNTFQHRSIGVAKNK